MKKDFGITFGPICDKISKQLKDQKLKFDKNDVDMFEKLADCIYHLRVSMTIPDSIYDQLLKRLYKKIETWHNKQKEGD